MKENVKKVAVIEGTMMITPQNNVKIIVSDSSNNVDERVYECCTSRIANLTFDDFYTYFVDNNYSVKFVKGDTYGQINFSLYE